MSAGEMGAHESKAMEHAGLASRPPQQWTPAELERFLLADPETSTHAAAVRRLKIDGKTAVSLLLTRAVGHGAVPTARSLGSSDCDARECACIWATWCCQAATFASLIVGGRSATPRNAAPMPVGPLYACVKGTTRWPPKLIASRGGGV